MGTPGTSAQPQTQPPRLGPGLSPNDFAAAVSAITSAFGDPTRRDIYLHARSTEFGVTASEVAEQFDLHPNVARHHLDKLCAGGYLDIASDRSSTGAGRPSKRYRVLDDRMPFEIPVRHDDVIVTLLGKALNELGAERATQMAEEVGREYGLAMAAAMGDTTAKQRSLRSALHTIADALSAHGFSARTDTVGTQLQIVSETCPFGEAAAEHPVICAVDRGMVSGMLSALVGETAVGLSASKSMGDDQCVTSIQP